ncbi:MAG: citrate lyase subunit beta [Dehalococcoidia bacterium]|nr:citrate lyase subunit beta [Dehalococcoidia bacterium]
MNQSTVSLRSLLFVPGNQPPKIEKARNLAPDILVLDLEDSVPPAEKPKARDIVSSLLPTMVKQGRGLFVRINPLISGLAEAEIDAVVQPGLDGISLPKVNTPDDIITAVNMIELREKAVGLKPGSIRLLPWIETARSILHAEEIARASTRIVALAFGADDYALDMNIVRSPEGKELLLPKGLLAIAARAAGVVAVDGIYANFRDEDGLLGEARLARQLGFAGKFLIHPAQISPVNRIFAPSDAEVEQAKKIVTAFEAAVAGGVAVTVVDGEMVDTPVAERAKKLLEQAKALDRENL